jgi:hypothetical protein
MGFSIGDIELKFKMGREKGVGRKRRGNSAFQYFDRTTPFTRYPQAVFSVTMDRFPIQYKKLFRLSRSDAMADENE